MEWISSLRVLTSMEGCSYSNVIYIYRERERNAHITLHYNLALVSVILTQIHSITITVAYNSLSYFLF